MPLISPYFYEYDEIVEAKNVLFSHVENFMCMASTKKVERRGNSKATSKLNLQIMLLVVM